MTPHVWEMIEAATDAGQALSVRRDRAASVQALARSAVSLTRVAEALSLDAFVSMRGLSAPALPADGAAAPLAISMAIREASYVAYFAARPGMEQNANRSATIHALVNVLLWIDTAAGALGVALPAAVELYQASAPPPPTEAERKRAAYAARRAAHVAGIELVVNG